MAPLFVARANFSALQLQLCGSDFGSAASFQCLFNLSARSRLFDPSAKTPFGYLALQLEAPVGIEPTVADLQSTALPLGDGALFALKPEPWPPRESAR